MPSQGTWTGSSASWPQPSPCLSHVLRAEHCVAPGPTAGSQRGCENPQGGPSVLWLELSATQVPGPLGARGRVGGQRPGHLSENRVAVEASCAWPALGPSPQTLFPVAGTVPALTPATR